MSWVLDHLQLLIAIAAAIAYWLNQRQREKAGKEADYDGDGVPEVPTPRRVLDKNAPDPEEEERARRIQEEIRRKIAQRRGEAPSPARPESAPPRPVMQQPVEEPPPLMSPRPVAGPAGELQDMVRRALEQRRAAEARARAEAAEAETAAIQERQRRLEEEMRALEERRRIEAARVAAARAATASVYATSATSLRPHDLLVELRSTESLRKAVLTREILGTPAGLR